MKLRIFFGTTLLAALAVTGSAQTMPEQTVAAGIAGGLATRGAPNALAAAKKAKMVKEKGDKRFLESPMDSGRQWADPTTAPQTKGGMMPDAKMGNPGMPQVAAAPMVAPPAPWQWRLKGLATGKGVNVAMFQAPDGRTAWVRVGDKIDDRSKVVRISSKGVVVNVDKQAVALRPW